MAIADGDFPAIAEIGLNANVNSKVALYKKRISIVLFALIVNMILFSLIPNLIARGVGKSDFQNYSSINIIKFKAPEPEVEPPPEKPPEQEKKPEPLKKPELSKPKRNELRLEMPTIDFEINPRLAGTIPVVNLNRPFSEGELDSIPVPTYKMAPQYPYRAKRLNISGHVKVRFLVTREGNIKNIEIVEAEPIGMFEKSVMKALASWRYSPGELTGEKVDTIVSTTIVFNLEN